MGYWGERQEKSVKSWQEQSGLKVDGLLKPGGPTITSLKQAAGGLLSGFRPPTPDEVDDHHNRLHQGEPGLLNTRPARLSLTVPADAKELDEQTLAFNADTARALTRSRVDGEVPAIYANYVKQAGADARPTIINLADQINESSGRDRAERVLHGIVGQVPAEQATALLGGGLPGRRPLGVRVADLPDDEVPLFRTAAATEAPKPEATPATAPATGNGGKLTEIATAPLPKPEKPDVLTVPVSAPVEGAGVQGGEAGQKPVQTADLDAAAAALLLGTTAVLGIGAASQRPQPQQKPQGQNTTTPGQQQPTALPGQKPAPEQKPATLPNVPPKPEQPNPPPSLPQAPAQGAGSYPGKPAQPLKPEPPLEIRKVDEIDHDKGGAPHPATQKGLEMIPDSTAREVIRGKMLGSGVTNGADAAGTNIEGKGTYEGVQKDQAEIARGLGLDPASIKPLNNQPGTGISTNDGRVTIVARPTSSKEKPTLEIQIKDENGVVIHKIKRRYGP